MTVLPAISEDDDFAIDFAAVNAEEPVTPSEPVTLDVAPHQSGWRLDLFLADAFPQYSRTLLRNAITSGGVIVDLDSAKPASGKPSYRLRPAQRVRVTLPNQPRASVTPEDIPLTLLYEDDDLVVVDKPPGMVVHPSRGHWSGTLVSALAFHFAGRLSTVRGPARPGIVHRLDRDTTGAILVAKHDVAHARLATLFQEKKVRKEYIAIVIGEPSLDQDFIDAAIVQHPRSREKMAIARAGDADAKEAQTRISIERRYRGFSLVHAFPQTGRTHQIRLHLMHRGHPVLCDPLYSSRATITREEIAGIHRAASCETEKHVLLSRHALHAHRLSFEHPMTQQEISVIAPMPADMQSVLDALEADRSL